MNRLNSVDKIVRGHLVSGSASKGIVELTPKHVMTHDNSSAVMLKFDEIWQKAGKTPRVHDREQVLLTLDHNIQDKSESNLQKYKRIEEFAKRHGITFYPAGRGIGHQVIVEEGYTTPGSIVVASDSHSNMYGGVNCLGTPVVRTDAAAIWCTGKTWWKTPPVARVELHGSLPKHTSGKDVILALCGLFKNDEVLNHAVEFVGPGVATLTVEERLTIANMTTEWGAVAGLFPADDVLGDWLEQQVKEHVNHKNWNSNMMDRFIHSRTHLSADENAKYDKYLSLELSDLDLLVTGPNDVKTATPVRQMEKERVAVNKAYLVSCVNSRASDIAEAAAVIKGKKIHPQVEFYVAAASSVVQKECEENGDWKSLIDAGARILPPGCGPCIGLGAGLLQAGEVGISATNRNFRGRMGSRDALAYLASPLVVAHSALNGYISGPPTSESQGRAIGHKIWTRTEDEGQEQPGEMSPTTLKEHFPKRLEGTVILCNADNINTDGIYPGAYTYKELSDEEQAKVVMENYDEHFLDKLQQGDILVAGANFGTGSSREQAATALLACGIRVVIAHSFNETYTRNAWNNGLIVLECPQVVKAVRKRLEKELSKEGNQKTVRHGRIVIDFEKEVVRDEDSGVEEHIEPVGGMAQELVVQRGLLNYVVRVAKEKD